MPFRIRDTINTAVGLCATCRNGMVTECTGGVTTSFCVFNGTVPIRLPATVEKCTQYDDVRYAKEWELKAIAWVLRTEKNGRMIGFVRPQDVPQDER